MNDPRLEIEVLCQVRHGAGRLVVRSERERIVLDAHADDCCMVVPDSMAVKLLCDVLGEWLG